MRTKLLLLALVTGCTAPPDGERQTDIINGTPLSDAESSGVVVVEYQLP